MNKSLAAITLSIIMILFSSCSSVDNSSTGSDEQMILNAAPSDSQSCHGVITKIIDFMVIEIKVEDDAFNESYTDAKPGETLIVTMSPHYFNENGEPAITMLDYYVNLSVGSRIVLDYDPKDTDITEKEGKKYISPKSDTNGSISLSVRPEFYDESLSKPEYFDDDGDPKLIDREKYYELKSIH